VALQYGLVGLILFFASIVIPLVVLLQQSFEPTIRNGRPPRAERLEPTDDWRQMIGVLAGVLTGWLFLVATTSNVGLTIHIGIVFAALAQGAIDLKGVSRRRVLPALSLRKALR
jgi:hypothetical protein